MHWGKFDAHLASDMVSSNMHCTDTLAIISYPGRHANVSKWFTGTPFPDVEIASPFCCSGG